MKLGFLRFLAICMYICMLCGCSTPDESKPYLQRYCCYSDFGAIGDGKTDDLSAIIATREFANAHGLPVKADEGAVYYIGSVGTAIIQTDTDWSGAAFIVDDREVPLDKRETVIFEVTPNKG